MVTKRFCDLCGLPAMEVTSFACHNYKTPSSNSKVAFRLRAEFTEAPESHPKTTDKRADCCANCMADGLQAMARMLRTPEPEPNIQHAFIHPETLELEPFISVLWPDGSMEQRRIYQLRGLKRKTAEGKFIRPVAFNCGLDLSVITDDARRREYQHLFRKYGIINQATFKPELGE